MPTKIDNGKRVRTVKLEHEASDLIESAKRDRRWGVTGQIVAISDAHGKCFQVRHDDGTLGWYEDHELVELHEPVPTEVVRKLSDAEALLARFASWCKYKEPLSDKAEWSVFAVLYDLLGRRGFDNTWDEIDDQIRAEILATNIRNVRRAGDGCL